MKRISVLKVLSYLSAVILLVLSGILISAGLKARKEMEQQARLPKMGKMPSFQLISHTGEPFDSASLRGHIVVLDFFFTSCTGVCPPMTQNLRRVQEALAGVRDLRIVSISVDPETDTPERLSEYARQNGAREGVWIFLTGDPQKIYSLASEGFRLGAGTSGGAVYHSDRFVLMDKEGNIRGFYKGTENTDVDQLIEDVLWLARNEK
jgi:protein SCO1/2